MNATQLPRRRKTTQKPLSAPARPVTAVLLDLAYHLHATRVVARLSAPDRPRTSAASRSI